MSVEWQAWIDVNGRELEVSVEAEGHVYRDLYGADADGNRGEWRTECDDVVLVIRDSRGNDITSKVFKRYRVEYDALEQAAVDQLVEAFNEPDFD